MINYTKKAILDTFSEMLSEKPFDKITVSSIVSKCEISSNTFYYHFRDIFNLLDIWIRREAERVIDTLEDKNSWTETLRAFLHKMQNNPDRVYNIWNSVYRERMERYVFEYLKVQLGAFTEKYTEGMGLNEDEKALITRFCSYSLLGFILNFLWNNLDGNVDEAIKNLNEMFIGAVERISRKSVI